MSKRTTVRYTGTTEIMVQFWYVLPGETVTIDTGTLDLLRQKHGDVFVVEGNAEVDMPTMTPAPTEPTRKGRARK
jgi:hypothetical protein